MQINYDLSSVDDNIEDNKDMSNKALLEKFTKLANERELATQKGKESFPLKNQNSKNNLSDSQSDRSCFKETTSDSKLKFIANIKSIALNFPNKLQMPIGLENLNLNQLTVCYDSMLKKLESNTSGYEQIVIMILISVEKFLADRKILDCIGGAQMLSNDPAFMEDLKFLCLKYLGPSALSVEAKVAFKLLRVYGQIIALKQIDKDGKLMQKISQVKT